MAGFTLQDMIDFAESNKQIKKSGGRIYNEGGGCWTKLDYNRDELRKDGDNIIYCLWDNPIATLNIKTGDLLLDDCGYQSITTKNRLNQIIPKTYIYQNKGDWYIGDATQKWNGIYKTNIMEML